MKLKVGKYYLSDTGERVGPMAIWDETAEHSWEEEGGGNRFDYCGDIWREDGTSDYNCPTLIEEVKE